MAVCSKRCNLLYRFSSLWLRYSFHQLLRLLDADWSQLISMTDEESKGRVPLPQCGHPWRAVLAPQFPGRWLKLWCNCIVVQLSSLLHPTFFTPSQVLLLRVVSNKLPSNISVWVCVQDIQPMTVWLKEYWNVSSLAYLLLIIHAFDTYLLFIEGLLHGELGVSFSEFSLMCLF